MLIDFNLLVELPETEETRQLSGGSGVQIPAEEIDCSLSTTFRLALGSIQPPIPWVSLLFLRRFVSRNALLPSDIHLVLKLGIGGAIPPLTFIRLHGVERNNYTFAHRNNMVLLTVHHSTG